MANKRELASVSPAFPLFSRCSRRELQIVARHIDMAGCPGARFS